MSDKEQPENLKMTEEQSEWRRFGRSEALHILLSTHPDDLDAYIGSHSIGDTGDYDSHWLPAELRELFDCDSPHSILDRLENNWHREWWRATVARDHVKALTEVIERAIEERMIPTTSAADGGAARYSEQVRIADALRKAVTEAREFLKPEEIEEL